MKKPLPLVFQILGTLLGIYGVYRGIMGIIVITNASIVFKDALHLHIYYLVGGLILIAIPFLSRGLSLLNPEGGTALSTKARLWWAAYLLLTFIVGFNFIGTYSIQENVVYQLAILLQALIALIILLVIGGLLLATLKAKNADVIKLTLPVRDNIASRQVFTGLVVVITILIGLQVFLPRVLEVAERVNSSSSSKSTSSLFLK